MVTEDCLNRVLPVVADSWTQLRRSDVDRLLNQIAYDGKPSLLVAAGIVAAKRPDLQKQIDQSVEWISEDRGWDTANLRAPQAGDKLIVTVPIDLAEDLYWPVGEEVEVDRLNEGGFEAIDKHGNEGSFANSDIPNWFKFA